MVKIQTAHYNQNERTQKTKKKLQTRAFFSNNHNIVWEKTQQKQSEDPLANSSSGKAAEQFKKYSIYQKLSQVIRQSWSSRAKWYRLCKLTSGSQQLNQPLRDYKSNTWLASRSKAKCRQCCKYDSDTELQSLGGNKPLEMGGNFDTDHNYLKSKAPK